jgi:hypothetical protein
MRRDRVVLSIGFLAFCALCPGLAQSPEAAVDRKLTAHSFDSGFALAHSTFNGMLAASDGKVYYVLCADSMDTGAQMYSYDPATDKIRHLGDLTEASGEKGLKAIPQGKSHVNFVEWNGKLYFASHLGYYSTVNGQERAGIPRAGYKPYPGGHFLAYDMASGTFEKLADAPPGQGIIAMSMDTKRGRIYGETWPNGDFLRYDMATKNLKDLGPTAKEGEAGTGPTYRILCRSMPVDPDDGSVYLTTADGDILHYRYDTDTLETLQNVNLRKDYFGSFNSPAGLGMGYNWRQTFWYAPDKAVYALHGRTGYLFRFDPRAARVEVLERLTSAPSRLSGMNDSFAYGYLSFALGPDGRTVYYLTTGPIRGGAQSPAGNGNARAPREDLRLVTYDIPTGKYEDHGAVLLEDGQRPETVHSIALTKDGGVYTLGTFRRNGRPINDLIRIQVK